MSVPDASGLTPWIPFFSVLGGAIVGSIASFGGSVVVQLMTLRREREHKENDRRDRLRQQSFDFYTKTLLDLQDALEQLVAVPKVPGGMPTDATTVLIARCVKLLARAGDPDLTQVTQEAMLQSVMHLNDRDSAPDDQKGDWSKAIVAYMEANERIGGLLRQVGAAH